jgi:hypothetical protein
MMKWKRLRTGGLAMSSERQFARMSAGSAPGVLGLAVVLEAGMRKAEQFFQQARPKRSAHKSRAATLRWQK